MLQYAYLSLNELCVVGLIGSPSEQVMHGSCIELLGRLL